MLEKVNRINYLVDFYEQLLTKKQKSIVEMYYKENFSLGEIADLLNITRQAVHDNLLRAIRALERWEAKLKLYETYLQRRKEGQQVLDLLEKTALDRHDIERIKDIVQKVLLEG